MSTQELSLGWDERQNGGYPISGAAAGTCLGRRGEKGFSEEVATPSWQGVIGAQSSSVERALVP